MDSPFKAVADELFRNQVKYKKGRYELTIPLGPSARLNWIGSKHWAIMQHNLVTKFGDDFFVSDYYSGKIWGHMFSSRVNALVKTKRIMAEMMGLISEHLGFGKIEPQKLSYGQDWITFKFLDSPISRESNKLYGKAGQPIDYSICGLVAGSAERVLGRKFITFETTCLANGDSCCTFETFNFEKAKAHVAEKMKNDKQKQIYEKILEMEEKTDFKKETDALIKNQNKRELMSEDAYLKR